MDASTLPLVHVIKGNPTKSQVAAITAVIAAEVANSGEKTVGSIPSEWGRPIVHMRPHWGSPTGFYKQLW